MTTLRSLTCYVLLFAFTQFTAAQSSSEMAASSAASAQLLGYTAQTSTAERDWEKKFQEGIVAANIRENDRRLSARPHHVGSPYDKDNAEWMLARFKEWGFDAHIETFDVLFPTPKERVLELIEPTKFRAKLQEPALAIDPTSNQTSEQLPTYNAYSIDGDVTAPLVYVNYGNRDDYEQLDRLGVSVKGSDRDCALRRRLARHQAQSRRRARRDRLHHLFRSQRATDISTAKIIPKAAGVRAKACSAAASWTPIIPVIL